MRSIFTVISIFLLILNLNALTETGPRKDVPNTSHKYSLFPLSNNDWGGYGGPHFKLGKIHEDFSMIGGGPIGIVIDPSFSVFMSFSYLEADTEGIDMWYGGFGSEYIFFPEKRFQLYLKGLIGYGSVDYDTEQSAHNSGFFVFEPEVLAGLKITEFDRVKLGMGYRQVMGIHDLPGLSNTDFSGFYGIVQLDYGIFDIQKRKELLQSREKFNILSGTYSIKFTKVNNQYVILDGGGTRFIVNRKYAIGASGYRSLSTVDYKGQELSLAYGGIWSQYIMSPLKKVHFSFSSLLGVGGIGYVNQESDEFTGKVMFVFETDLFLDINITEFMRAGIGWGYRLMTGSFNGLNTWDMSDNSATIQLRFGGF